MIRKLLSLFLIVMTLLKTTYAIADLPSIQVPVTEPDVGEAISPMKQGQKAPFTGVLLSPKAVANITADVRLAPEKIKIERDDATKICEAKANFDIKIIKIESDTDKKILNAQVVASNEQNKLLKERIKEYDDEIAPEVWAAGGMVVGIITTILVVYGVNQAEK